jgi:hypothetical protein
MSAPAFNGQKTQLTSASLALRARNIAVLSGNTEIPLAHLSDCTLCQLWKSCESEMIQTVSNWIRLPVDTVRLRD